MNSILIRGLSFRTVTVALLVALFIVVGYGCEKGEKNPAETKVTIDLLVPTSPASLAFGENVTIIYTYDVVESDGVRIWVQPYTAGTISPAYRYTSSPLFTGAGTRTVTVSVTTGDLVVVDHLMIKIANADGSEVISTELVPVNYTFSPL
jgi:hypothetical protein